MRISMFHEIDVRDAARRVMTLSRQQMGRVVGIKADTAAAMARRKERRGEPLTDDEMALLR